MDHYVLIALGVIAFLLAACFIAAHLWLGRKRPSLVELDEQHQAEQLRLHQAERAARHDRWGCGE